MASMSMSAFSSFSSCRASQCKPHSTRRTAAASKSQLPPLVLQKSTTSSSSDLAKPSSSQGFLQKHSETGAVCLAALLGLGLFLQSDSAAIAAEAIQNFQGEHIAQRGLGDLAMFTEEDSKSVMDYLVNFRSSFIFLVTVSTGGLYALVRPVVNMFKTPRKSVVGVLVVVGGTLFIYGTLMEMLDGTY